MFAGQLLHVDDAGEAKVPALHALHVMAVDAPSTDDDVPGGHETQLLPSMDEKVPVGHMSTIRISFEMDEIVACCRLA